MNLTIVPKDDARSSSRSKSSSNNALSHIEGRRSRELVIALSGPAGAGTPVVRAELEAVLKDRNYKPIHIKLSSHFAAQAERLKLQQISDAEIPKGSVPFRSIWKLQNLGNQLRSSLGDDMAAQLAIKEIAVDRAEAHPKKELDDIEPHRVAYIIDQLKHPKEVALLRELYGDLLFIVGVLSDADQRQSNLESLGMTMPEAAQLMARDRKESESNGQQLEKTLHHADFFVNHSAGSLPALRTSLARFIGLVHGDAGLTPNVEERAMFAAYSASLNSACLSRQVGAAIADASGNVISTGCNDVPKAGGGLYEPDDGDRRCVHWGGYCYNDHHKDKLREEIEGVLRAGGLEQVLAETLAAQIKDKTRVGALIEFSRAVHAEMDAIICVARTCAKGLVGATLYSTVYPCHNCARHIIAAGIAKVVYIEPYEKSLAAELHKDALRPDLNKPDGQVVKFIHFEGVSPRKFSRLFQVAGARKDSKGIALKTVFDAPKKETEYLDDYRRLEVRVVERLLEIEAAAAAIG